MEIAEATSRAGGMPAAVDASKYPCILDSVSSACCCCAGERPISCCCISSSICVRNCLTRWICECALAGVVDLEMDGELCGLPSGEPRTGDSGNAWAEGDEAAAEEETPCCRLCSSRLSDCVFSASRLLAASSVCRRLLHLSCHTHKDSTSLE